MTIAAPGYSLGIFKASSMRSTASAAPDASRRLRWFEKTPCFGRGSDQDHRLTGLQARPTSEVVPGPSTPQATTTSLVKTLIALRASPIPVNTATSTSGPSPPELSG